MELEGVMLRELFEGEIQISDDFVLVWDIEKQSKRAEKTKVNKHTFSIEHLIFYH